MYSICYNSNANYEVMQKKRGNIVLLNFFINNFSNFSNFIFILNDMYFINGIFRSSVNAFLKQVLCIYKCYKSFKFQHEQKKCNSQ